MSRLAKLRWLGVAFCVLAGCRSSDVEVKPTNMPEEYIRPPDEPRFTNNLEYPKDQLFTDVIKKDSIAPVSPGSSPSTLGRSGMGGRPGF